MAARVRSYYGDPCQVYHGVTQGDSLSPQIFNVVVDAIILHYSRLVANNKAVPNGFVHALTDKSPFFYAEDGLVASTNIMWLQWSFNMMIIIFEQIGLCTNVPKTVVMV